MTNASRPYDSAADNGFPSGHASASFAFARVISAEYEQWEEEAYLGAAAVAYSRLQRNAHTLGQVAAGAVLGWYIADRSLASDGVYLAG